MIGEENVTGSGEVYNKNFCDDDYEDKIEEMLGRTLNEVNYKEFKTDNTLNSRQKINTNIKSINQMLREVERLVDHASKLKLESGADQNVFWKGTSTSFGKIKERLNRLNQKIVEIGS